jgi:hypothetical protein
VEGQFFNCPLDLGSLCNWDWKMEVINPNPCNRALPLVQQRDWTLLRVQLMVLFNIEPVQSGIKRNKRISI